MEAVITTQTLNAASPLHTALGKASHLMFTQGERKPTPSPLGFCVLKLSFWHE